MGDGSDGELGLVWLANADKSLIKAKRKRTTGYGRKKLTMMIRRDNDYNTDSSRESRYNQRSGSTLEFLLS